MAFGSGSSLATDCSTRRRGSPALLKLCKFGWATLLHQHSSCKPTTQVSRFSSVLGNSHQSVAPPFFLAYRGSGEVIQRLARCQRTPILAKVARIVSPLTRSFVSLSSKLTCAAISKDHKLLSLPNFLGE